MDRILYQAHFEHDERHWWYEGRRAIVQTVMRTVLHVPPQATLLDVGSGAGGMVPLLQRFGTVSVLEPDREAAGRLQEKFGGHVPVTLGTLDSLTDGQQFDCISLFDVLEHIDDDRAALASIYMHLRNDGYFVCTVPAFQLLWGQNDVASHHKRRYTKKELRLKIEQAGLRIRYISFFNFFLFFPTLVVRLFSRLGMGSKDSDFKKGSGAFNTIFKTVFSSERHLLERHRLPFGVSLICIAQKKI